jgi:hypothetical protein
VDRPDAGGITEPTPPSSLRNSRSDALTPHPVPTFSGLVEARLSKSETTEVDRLPQKASRIKLMGVVASPRKRRGKGSFGPRGGKGSFGGWLGISEDFGSSGRWGRNGKRFGEWEIVIEGSLSNRRKLGGFAFHFFQMLECF